jgi:hypothetical protein
MKDVDHAHRGAGCDDHDRLQVEGGAEDDQQGSRAHDPQDRMGEDPATEAVAGQLVVGLHVVGVVDHHGVRPSAQARPYGGFIIDDVRSAITA